MKIICFGDSLTRGVSFVKGRLKIIKENYPNFLQELFSSSPEETRIINKGVFNDNSDSLVQRLEKDVIKQHPDYTIIEIGGNDCNFIWKNVAEMPEEKHLPIVPLERYIENVKTIISRLKEEGITPVILTLPPLDPVRYYQYLVNLYGKSISHCISTVGGIEHWHGLYNRALNSFVDGMDAFKIDVRTALKKAGDLSQLISDDGIHLTSKGYQELSQSIFRELTKIQGKNEWQYFMQGRTQENLI
ncbi:SGNH/GDSL hydrolase family protein [Cytobacillus sp. Hz8]|uniref:SGNH/GDSL hydrolase family protein n=1 Tax=Cytobacillus sp. Hz8 TaxID=3347168 RepID=UPI0035D5F84D